MRRKLVVGNWKMYGRLASNQALLEAILAGVRGLRGADYAVCVPYPYLAQAQSLLQGSNVAWGAQNLNQHEEGAFTGAVAPGMLADFGCSYVLVGHSERRGLFHESNEVVSAKFDAALKAGMKPILCVGETLAERESGVTEQVVAMQLDAVLNRGGAQVLSKAMVAYEPVWAIGTGTAIEPSEAEYAHKIIRLALNDMFGMRIISQNFKIIYGGSINSKNVKKFAALENMDGLLVGGVGLKVDDFSKVVKSIINLPAGRPVKN